MGICTELTVRTTICICMCVYLSKNLHTWGEILACWRMSQCVLADVSDDQVERRHSHMLHRWRFLRLVHIHQSTIHVENNSVGQNIQFFPLVRRVALYLRRYWRDNVFRVDSSLSQALRWGRHWVRLELLDVPTQWSYLSLHCFLSLDPLTL